METNVLDDIKKMVGITEYSNEFDIDILSLINTAFFSLYQLGIGGNKLIVVDENSKWTDLNTSSELSVIREYVYLRVKEIFDTPQSSYAANALKERMAEMEFRLGIENDNGGGGLIDV